MCLGEVPLPSATCLWDMCGFVVAASLSKLLEKESVCLLVFFAEDTSHRQKTITHTPTHRTNDKTTCCFHLGFTCGFGYGMHSPSFLLPRGGNPTYPFAVPCFLPSSTPSDHPRKLTVKSINTSPNSAFSYTCFLVFDSGIA